MANSTQEGILDAAEEVFASHGYEGASMRAIAKKANVNQALLHYHFQTKDNLYETVVKRRSSAIKRIVRAGIATRSAIQKGVLPEM